MNRQGQLEDFIRNIQRIRPTENNRSEYDGFVVGLVALLGWPLSRMAAPRQLENIPGASLGFVLEDDDGEAHGLAVCASTDQLPPANQEHAVTKQMAPVVLLSDGLRVCIEHGHAADERLALHIDLLDGEPGTAAADLLRFLGRDETLDGTAREELLLAQENRRRGLLRERLATTFNRLLGQGDDLMVDLLIETAEEEDGRSIPTTLGADVVRSFQRPELVMREVVGPPPMSPAPAACAELGFTYLGRWAEASSARGVLHGVVLRLAQGNPAFFEALSEATRGRKRMLIARDPLHLYPGKPALCRKEHPLVPGRHI